MPFIKYPSIENHYYKEHINFKKQEFPGMADGHFLIHEKIHGANIQIILDVDKPMEVGTRNKVLAHKEKFNDIWNTLKDYMAPIEIFQEWGLANNKNLNLYCELFGTGIGKGVKYHDYKEIKLIGIRIDGELLAPAEEVKLLTNLRISSFYAPVIDVVKGLHMALAIKACTPTRIAPFDSNNIMEGVVIKPYFKVYIDGNGSPFMLKKKNPEFMEKAKERKHDKDRKPLPAKVVILNANFRSFITEARLTNIFSKWGVISAPNEIGDYIKYMLADAKEDFMKEHDKHILADLDQKETKAVFNVGSTIATMLKKYL